MAIDSYWLQLVWLFIVAILGSQFFELETDFVNGVECERWNWIQTLFLSFPFILWAAIRSESIGDTGMYVKMFADAPSSFRDLSAYYGTLTKDKGFFLSNAIFKCIFGDHHRLFFFLIAIVQMYIIIRLFRKYSIDVWFSFFIFVASTDYTAWMLNGTRQFLAATIICCGIDWFLEGKYVRVLLLIIFASFFHQSALVMIPFMIVIKGRAWNARTIIAIILCILAVVYVARFTNILDSMLESTQYTNVVTEWQEFQDDGTNPIRVLVYSVPAIIAVAGYKWIIDSTDPMINMCVNASFLVSGLYMVSMVTSGLFLGRIPIYLTIFSNGILLPWEINMLFEEQSSWFVKGLAVVLFSVFFYYQMHFSWGFM